MKLIWTEFRPRTTGIGAVRRQKSLSLKQLLAFLEHYTRRLNLGVVVGLELFRFELAFRSQIHHEVSPDFERPFDLYSAPKCFYEVSCDG